MKKAVVQRKIASNILSNTDSALLAVQHLVATIVSNHPIHHIEWKTVLDSFNYGIALLFFINKLTLIFWANIKFATISRHAFLGTIFVASYHFTNLNFMQINFHIFLLNQQHQA